MTTESKAAQTVQEARRLGAEGRVADACSLLQSLIFSIGDSAALREHKATAYNGLLSYLHAARRDGRLSKVFRQAIAEFSALRDPDFDGLYLAGLLATRTPPVPLRRRDRFLLLLRKFEQVRDLEGRVAECGCFQGLSSFLLCSRMKQQHPAFDGSGYEIYDSFQGLSDPGPEDRETGDTEAVVSIATKKGMYAARLDDVKQALSPFPGIAYFPGWIPARFAADNANRYRFVHVDVDLFQPTFDSFEYFWPRLVAGGMIVCDDFNWPGGRQAVEKFCAKAGISFEITPMNQAYFSRLA